MFAISPTDTNWVEFLKTSELNSYVNFWTPTPWNVKNLNINSRLYFMLKSPIRKIAGFGEFVEYKNLSAFEAWKEFGYRNGRSSKEEFIKSIQNYIDKNSEKFGGKSIDINTYEIGCIILKNCEYFEEDNFIDLEELEIKFPKEIVKIKYFYEYDSILNILSEKNNFDFNLLSEERDDQRRYIKTREGQGGFKGKVLRAYNNRCCISQETIPELLEVAHIQNYKNKDSHHIQNGIILRTDFHKLYDNGLVFIDKNYSIHISSLITNEYYRQYHGKKIKLPSNEHNYPSKIALELKRIEFRI